MKYIRKVEVRTNDHHDIPLIYWRVTQNNNRPLLKIICGYRIASAFDNLYDQG